MLQTAATLQIWEPGNFHYNGKKTGDTKVAQTGDSQFAEPNLQQHDCEKKKWKIKNKKQKKENTDRTWALRLMLNNKSMTNLACTDLNTLAKFLTATNF